jgi:hypothetical protein
MGVISEFARALVSAITSMNAPGYLVHKSVWGKLLEPIPQRAGSWRLAEGSVLLELSRFDSLYGYLRLRLGDCSVEAVLEYRQWHVVVKPQRVDGSCRAEGSPRGIEGLEED